MSPKLFSDSQLQRQEIDVVKQWLRHKLGGYRIAINDVRSGNVVYRGVECAALPQTVARISYPPADRVLKPGRANRAGISLFYASVAGPACFYELKARVGQQIALSEWQSPEPLWMHNLGFHPEALRRLGVTDSGRARFASPFPIETKENARLRLQLSLAFTRDVCEANEYLYKLSIAIFESMFDKADPLPTLPNGSRFNRPAGVVYPAMQLRGAADNIVLFPEFVDRVLRLKSVQVVRVEEADEARSTYTLLTLAVSGPPDGAILRWQELTGPEIDRRTYVSLEDDHWVMRNGHGHIYFRK